MKIYLAWKIKHLLNDRRSTIVSSSELRQADWEML